MEEFSIINPYTLKCIEKYRFEPISSCEKKINQLHDSFLNWRTTSVEVKEEWLNELAKNLTENQHNISSIISSDMGKPIRESEREVQKCIQCCQFYADNAALIHSKLTKNNGYRSPVGVVMGIMPWNFPLWQLIRFLVPAIVVGNTCAIKPAYNTYRIALKLIECAPLGSSIMDCILPTDSTTSSLISFPTVAGISFTGSVTVGKQIGQLAAVNFKPCVLELGGSDPFLIFKGADLNSALDAAVNARFSNAGQTCISAKRFLFESSIFDQAMKYFEQKSKAFLTFGDPLNPKTTIGPMARQNLQETVLKQIKEANLNSDDIKFKYSPNNKTGFFVEPIIIDGRNLSSNNTLFEEEIFGPVAICDSFNSTQEGIDKANNTKFGLGASIWSTSKQTIESCISSINCGTIAVNKPVHSAFGTPFGGWKQSGIGLELGFEGALSFTKFKAIQ